MIKVRPNSSPPGTSGLARINSRMAAQHKYTEALDLTWEEFLRGYALPNMQHGVNPFNQQRDIRWTSDDIPEWTSSLGVFPRMRSNIIELVGRYQQMLLEPYIHRVRLDHLSDYQEIWPIISSIR